MEIKSLKEFLYNNPDKIKFILEELGFGHIKLHNSPSGDDYYTCSNPDGNNQTAVTIYISPSLLVINYTRDMCVDKVNTDFIDLVCFSKPQQTFFENLKWISEKAEIDYYYNFNDNIPESLRILKVLKELLNKQPEQDEDNTPIEPKDPVILNYYQPYLSQMFYEDGIDYQTQFDFGICYDQLTNNIVIPCYDEICNLVGIKGRYFDRIVPEHELKYVYLERFPKGKILFGYHKTGKYIQESDTAIVGEAEKFVMSCWSQGIKNTVSTGGTKVTKTQIEKLSRLNKRILLAFDQDYPEEKIQHLRNMFLPQIQFYAIIDKEHILGEKQSPSDDPKKLQYLLKNHVYEIEFSKEENN